MDPLTVNARVPRALANPVVTVGTPLGSGRSDPSAQAISQKQAPGRSQPLILTGFRKKRTVRGGRSGSRDPRGLELAGRRPRHQFNIRCPLSPGFYPDSPPIRRNRHERLRGRDRNEPANRRYGSDSGHRIARTWNPGRRRRRTNASPRTRDLLSPVRGGSPGPDREAGY